MVSFTPQLSIVLLLLLSATAFNRSICSKNRVVRCSAKDRWTLLIFKKGVVDSSNVLSSWSSEEDCCAWIGVQCDNITGRVIKLDLNGEKQPQVLRGEINLSLLQLEFLNYLDLSDNCFESISIPPISVSRYAKDRQRYDNQSQAISSPPTINFSNLQYLDLSQNCDVVMDDLQWLSPISSLKYLDLSGIDLGNKTRQLRSIAMLPSLLELHLVGCNLSNISPSLRYINFTALVTLDLSYNKFESDLPDWLSKLRNLKSLMLNSNKLNGSIPDWLGQLDHLNYLDLSDNLFNGFIPSTLGNLSSLTDIDLSNNHLIGDLPTTLSQLYNLKSLEVGSNSLVGVLSEMNFAKLSNLETLYLESTRFTFNLDPNWVPPFQLRDIGLRNTSLGPNFPSWLYSQRSLEHLDISSSGISYIDEDMFWSFVAGIQVVSVSHNSISGDLSKVTLNSSYIYLDYNNFTGGLPYISPNVIELGASHNSFSGSIFPMLCDPVNGDNLLWRLDISYNHLTGALPNCWANWKLLRFLYMGRNKLTGEVPPSMGVLTNLASLDLQNNSFYGELSFDLSNWTNLESLNLRENNFSGSLPITLMQQQNLQVIILRSNQFTGNIPQQICSHPFLIILDLADNMLSGSIPQCLYNLTGMSSGLNTSFPGVQTSLFIKGQELEYRFYELLRSIDVSTNNLTGEIPHELFSLIQVQSLNLSYNHLEGKIPKQIGGMKYLESLDLSHNKLSGEIPQTISNLSFLNHLNLSHNNFTGQIPLGTQIQSFDASSFIGNTKLCGSPLPNCQKEEEPDNQNMGEANEDDIFLKSLYLGMGVGFAAGFWGACGSLFLNRAWRHKFFLFFDRLKNRVYVAVAIKFKNFR